jgi:hypothetical protein
MPLPPADSENERAEPSLETEPDWAQRFLDEQAWMAKVRETIPPMPADVVGIRVCFDYAEGPGVVATLQGKFHPEDDQKLKKLLDEVRDR